MPKKLLVELRELCRISAIEAANEHIEFTKNNLPAWAKGHEAELAEVFKHYAVIGSNDACSTLRRQGIV